MTQKQPESPSNGKPAPITGIVCALGRHADEAATTIASNGANVGNRKTLSL